jgi:hypothetical protein
MVFDSSALVVSNGEVTFTPLVLVELIRTSKLWAVVRICALPATEASKKSPQATILNIFMFIAKAGRIEFDNRHSWQAK